MSKIRSILFLFLWLTNWALSACQPDKASLTPAQILDVMSLKKHLPELENAAKQWDKDAYLVKANMPVYLSPNKHNLWLISATFQSPTYDNLSLLVKLEADGKIRTEAIGHSIPIIQTKPIRADDWRIDSPEALIQFASTLNIINFLESGNDAFLFLERRNINAQSLVIWRFAIVNEGSYFYLDANSGDELSITE